ncbi:MAG: MBL fold metallo-hydrolase [Acidobacteriota bacterium]|nr:MBL fold metallo-hydrolase [Acidobacteriota bacterium]
MTEARNIPPVDRIFSPAGEIELTFFGHASLAVRADDRLVYVDPVASELGRGPWPAADLILVTHEHYDHLDPALTARLRGPATIVAASPAAAAKIPGAVSLGNGDSRVLQGFRVEAVPAYNVTGMRSAGVPFHPRGAGNGYVVDFQAGRVYIAGDTENVPEIQALRDIRAAFLPILRPFTMSPEMAAAWARAVRPAILYPYHTGDADPGRLVHLMRDCPDIDVRVFPMR